MLQYNGQRKDYITMKNQINYYILSFITTEKIPFLKS